MLCTSEREQSGPLAGLAEVQEPGSPPREVERGEDRDRPSRETHPRAPLSHGGASPDDVVDLTGSSGCASQQQVSIAPIVGRGDDSAETTWGRSEGRKKGARRTRKPGAKLLAVALCDRGILPDTLRGVPIQSSDARHKRRVKGGSGFIARGHLINAKSSHCLADQLASRIWRGAHLGTWS